MTSKGVIVSFDVKEQPRDVLALLLEMNLRKQKHWLLNPETLQKVQQEICFHIISENTTQLE